MTTVVEIRHGKCAAIDDGLARIVAILHVKRYVGIFVDSYVALARDATLARKRIFSAVEEDSVGNHWLVEDNSLLTGLSVEYDSITSHESRSTVIVEVLSFIIPHLTLVTSPHHVGLWGTSGVYLQNELVVNNKQVVVDSIESASLQL